MFKLENVSNRIVAAATSITFSIIVFATAIMPANQGALLPVGIA